MKQLALVLLFFAGCAVITAQQVTVTGKVTDDEGAAIPARK